MNACHNQLQVTAYNGAGNETSFNLVKTDNTPLNLTTLVDAVVEVSVHNPLGVNWVITSASSSIRFNAGVLFIKFGMLNLPQGVYYPRISYTHADDNEPEVVVARGALTEMVLTAYEQ